MEVLTLGVLGALGFAHAQRPISEFITHSVIFNLGHLAPTPNAMMGLATAVAIFSYDGFGAAVYFSEEMHEAPRLVARTILLALVLTVAFEFIPVNAVLMGASGLKGLLASQSPFGDFLLRTGGRTLDTVISLGIALAIVNAVIATVLINSPFLFSSGRDGVWHGWFNTALTRMHVRFQSPLDGDLAGWGVGLRHIFHSLPHPAGDQWNGCGGDVSAALPGRDRRTNLRIDRQRRLSDALVSVGPGFRPGGAGLSDLR